MDKIRSKVSPILERKNESKDPSPLSIDDYNIQHDAQSASRDVPLIHSEVYYESRSAKIYRVLTSLTIEPAVFGFMFAFVMNMSVLTNMMIDKGCLYHLNYSAEICNNLSYYKDEKKMADRLATNYALYSNLTSLIAAFFMVFIAPWSDKYGRRIPLLVSIAGATLTDVGFMLCSYYFESRLEYLILARLPAEFTGGFICMLTIVFSHASEVSSEKNRTLKYTSIEVALGLAMSLGGLTGGFMYSYFHSYFYIYVVVGAIHVFSFLWTLFVVEETTGLDAGDISWIQKARDFFTCDSFKAGAIATCRRRERNTRALILLLLLSMCTIILNYEAFGSIAYVFVHYFFDWGPTQFSIMNTTSGLAGLMVTLLLVPFFIRVLKMNDFTLGIIGIISMLIKNLLFAFSPHQIYLYYIGLGLGIFTPLSTLAIRTGISKLIAKDELGRVFSFLATCEAVIPMIGTVAVTQIFNSTMDIYPNITYSVGVLLLILPLVTFIYALTTTKMSYNELSVSANDHVIEKA